VIITGYLELSIQIRGLSIVCIRQKTEHAKPVRKPWNEMVLRSAGYLKRLGQLDRSASLKSNRSIKEESK